MEFSLPALPQGYGKSALLWHDLVHKGLCGLGILLNVIHTHDRLIDFIMEIRQDNFQVAKLLGALEKHMPYRLGDTAYGIAGTCDFSLWNCRDLCLKTPRRQGHASTFLQSHRHIAA